MAGVLKVLSSPGVWTPVGAVGGEVWIGPSAPPDPAVDIWYDTDEVSEQVLTTGQGDTRYPLGTIAYAQAITNQTGITTVADLTGLSVTFTAVAERSYKLTMSTWLTSSVALDVVRTYLTDAANSIKQMTSVQEVGSLATGGTSERSWVTSGLSGSVTYKLRGIRNNGTGTVTLVCDTTRPAFLLVEDIGVL